MPNICRIGDLHSCGAIDTSGSSDTFINGKSVHRLGDNHSHGGIQIVGSPNIFVNGKNIARIGDNKSSCPSFPHPPNPEVSGSQDTFAN